jgi:hypothetical protein
LHVRQAQLHKVHWDELAFVGNMEAPIPIKQSRLAQPRVYGQAKRVIGLKVEPKYKHEIFN